MTLKIMIVTLIVGLSGCVRTGYQPFQLFGTGGYKDERISEDTYQVAYYGNHLTSMEAINSLLQYRSAELTLESGFDYFEVLKGYARRPMSSLGGFRVTQHIIKMHKGSVDGEMKNKYVASDVIGDFGPSIRE